jgi:hypothetical protein
MATHNCHRPLNICDNGEDLQQIQLTSTKNYFFPLTNPQQDPGNDDAIAMSQTPADIHQVKEPSTQPLKSAMKV